MNETVHINESVDLVTCLSVPVDAVLIQHIAAASQLVGGANPRRDAMLNRESVAAVLNRMFNCASQEVTVAASEETGSLLFRLLDRSV